MARFDRRHTTQGSPRVGERVEARSPSQKDRDRILYTSALRRLSGVTQVASAAEGSIFHNRLTHTLEVAQVGAGIAEFLLGAESQTETGDARVEDLGGLDVHVVEAAALAHDLGHPPFGHIAEEELNSAVYEITKSDGFEGNAQSFRVVTRLALRHRDFSGLDLTRASLNAILKYPWLWEDRPADKSNKWGAYATERAYFEWVRQDGPSDPHAQSLEAAVMDWADDIAYAVHDLEDFYRAGLIPLEILSRDDDKGAKERHRFVSGILARSKEGGGWRYTSQETEAAANKLLDEMREAGIDARYDGGPSIRRILRQFTAGLIGRYITLGAKLGNAAEPLKIRGNLKREVSVLKELTWHYVINGPQLSTQQQGQRRIVRELFSAAYEAISARRWWVLPTGFQGVVEEAYTSEFEDEVAEPARLAADFVAGLTEQEAIVLHRRITGVELGRLLGPM